MTVRHDGDGDEEEVRGPGHLSFELSTAELTERLSKIEMPSDPTLRSEILWTVRDTISDSITQRETIERLNETIHTLEIENRSLQRQVLERRSESERERRQLEAVREFLRPLTDALGLMDQEDAW